MRRSILWCCQFSGTILCAPPVLIWSFSSQHRWNPFHSIVDDNLMRFVDRCNEVGFVDKTKTFIICRIDTQYLGPRLDSKFVYSIFEVIQYFQIWGVIIFFLFIWKMQRYILCCPYLPIFGSRFVRVSIADLNILPVSFQLWEDNHQQRSIWTRFWRRTAIHRLQSKSCRGIFDSTASKRKLVHCIHLLAQGTGCPHPSNMAEFTF